MAFDITCARVVAMCAGGWSTHADFIGRLKQNPPGGIGPDHGFGEGLSRALVGLAKEGLLSEKFSEQRQAFTYSASKEQVEAAKGDGRSVRSFK